MQDSAQGWWPNHWRYRYAPYAGMTDDQYPWWALDHGNIVNAAPIHGRVRGVTGVWHSDPGAGASPYVRWTPLAGSKSAWCGLRATNDNSVIDPITKNPYNGSLAEFIREAGNTQAQVTVVNYPGYGNQWDQILYRDLQPASGQPLEIAFLYRTRMSTSYTTAASSRTGWFHGDPLGSVTSPAYPGNFISSSAAGSNAPRDSFSVYIGIPVDDANCLYSDGTIKPVYDKQRRWFDEVIRVFDAPYYELLGQAGSAPADTLSPAVSWDQIIPWNVPAYANGPTVAALYNDVSNPSHIVRLVFRVKTNYNYSDEDYGNATTVANGFASYGRGAALIDDVKMNGTVIGDFEPAGLDIDNSLAVAATAAWKSTGKPTALYVHPENVNLVTWKDLCGAPHSATSHCNVQGIVMSAGNADQFGSIADSRYESMSEMIYGMVSPTINMVTNPDNVTANPMGITGAMTIATDDYYLDYDINFAAFVLSQTGTLWNFGIAAYPAKTASGNLAWGDIVRAPYRFFQSFDGCQPDIEPLKGYSMLHTDAASGIPDSVRVYLGLTAECFYFGGSCNTTDGAYFDNISFVMANQLGGSAVGSLAADIWQFFNDAFPVNGLASDNVAAGSAAFDTTTALVKSAINTTASTGDALRFDVLADSVVINAPDGTGADPTMRVDLVFRILPGPGNYQIAAGRAFPPTSGMKLLKVPTNQSQLAVSGDNSFWGQYMATPGAFASGNHHSGAWWDYLTWNSARMDTAETNIFPVVGKAGGVGNGSYQSTYHELDPHFQTLGIVKTQCFVIDTSLSATSANISCDSTVAIAWLTTVPRSRTGWNGIYGTKEYTKIIPDGLLTPGSHVQYFYRKQANDGSGDFVMLPDTTTIWPQNNEGPNYDAHRWQHFGVLPDRWKDVAFGGAGAACMLYIDNNNRRGDQQVWVSVMDSIGGTGAQKWGANNGWHATGGGFGLNPTANASVAAAFIPNKNQQPGTAWDMYAVKASESAQTGGTHIGNRYANQAGMGLMDGKTASIGPRKAWLRSYYRFASWLTGDLNTQMVGPFTNVGEDDLGLIEDFLATPGGTTMPRALFVQGDGFAEDAAAQGADHLAFLNNYLFAGFRTGSYTNLTPGLVGCPDLTVSSSITTHGDVYAVQNSCTTTNDVLTVGTVESQAISDYQNVGVNGPYHASIEHVATGTYNWHSVIDAWDIYNTYGRYCATSNGRLAYYYNLMTNTFGGLCGNWGTPATTLDVPQLGHAGQFVNFMKVGNSVMRSGAKATINFGVESTGRVSVNLYDVTGRHVRTLADRTFQAGNDHSLTWDGSDDSGSQVARGVYFARIQYAAKGAAINGRVVVLR